MWADYSTPGKESQNNGKSRFKLGEEGTTLPFRLYDFLAYLFPGAATMHALYVMRSQDVAELARRMSTGSLLVNITVGFIAAYLIGLVWSVVSREGLRKLVWRYCCNPRIDYFSDTPAARKTLGVALNKRLREKVHEVFGMEAVDAHQAHRLCRVYVSMHSPAASERRESIVGVRAMSANCVGPVLLYGIAFAINGWWVLSVIAVLGAGALIAKMITLDQREWKQIYFAFLAGTVTSLGGRDVAGGVDG